jgi:hypothetical protein
MSERWFYVREGRQHGPHTPEELGRLLTLGQVGPGDAAWPEHGGKPCRVGDLVGPPAGASDLPPRPDWLGDVRRAEDIAALQPEPIAPPTGVPDWVADVKQREESAPPPHPPLTAKVPPARPLTPGGPGQAESGIPLWVLFALAGVVLVGVLLAGLAFGLR